MWIVIADPNFNPIINQNNWDIISKTHLKISGETLIFDWSYNV